ncbi:helix-turn-helix transcriptional regulator [Streptococcus oriscaviae]|uniref:Helix-turn-helix transcriptional regulator n=1 Tax=Streptococcus oriscaviae TaxID=2781599 RepID=A0ABX7YPB7_9STRE|nr:helix-turn-helix transcriptional regulator [Streptococcus oriscaviae]QUE55114.1 helix-turn-helix transcriptional regulator [Streptococcus oriscaviae]
MKLNKRQESIIELVKSREPITGDDLAKQLSVGKSTIRNELAVLIMIGILEAKPNVGYYYNENYQAQQNYHFQEKEVKDVMGIPIVAKQTDGFSDVVTKLYIHDVGTIFIVDEDGYLVGIVSRKDLLKMALSNPIIQNFSVALAMTRVPNIIYCKEEERVLDALKKIGLHQVDCLPVVVNEDGRLRPIGRISKTTILSLLLESMEGIR